MAIIKNTIKLTDEMSAVLEKIRAEVKGVEEALDEVSKSGDMMSDYFDLASAKAAEFAEESREAFEMLTGSSDETIEAFKDVEEAVAEMTAAVEEKAAAVDGVSESVKRLGKEAGGSSRGMNQMAQASARLLGNLGIIPRQLAQSMQGAAQLNRAMGAAVPTAAKLTAALGPLTLIATGVMAAVSAFQMLRRETEEVGPAFSELVGKQERLTRESYALSKNLNENIGLIELMNSVGANEGFLNMLEAQNEALGFRIETLGAFSEMMAVAARNEATAAAEALLAMRTVREQVWSEGSRDFHDRDAIHASMQVVEREIGTVIDYLFDRVSEAGANLSGELADEFYTVTNEMMQLADTLRQSVIPEQRKLASQLDADLARLKSLRESVVGVASEYETLADSLEFYTRQIADAERMQRSLANAQTRMARSITSGFRDIYDAAERTRSAHSALEHAINGTNSAYYSQMDIFSQIMSISPTKLMMMFDEYGALRDMEEAVDAMTDAYIDNKAVKQAMALISETLIFCYENESQVIGIVSSETALNTTERWANVDAIMAQVEALQHLDGAMAIIGAVDAIRSSAASARSGSRGGGAARPNTVGTGRGRAMLVSDPANEEIRGEMVRLMEDVSRHRYMVGGYQSGAPSVSLGNITINAAPNMSTKQLAKEVGEDICKMVAKQMSDAYRSNLSH